MNHSSLVREVSFCSRLDPQLNNVQRVRDFGALGLNGIFYQFSSQQGSVIHDEEEVEKNIRAKGDRWFLGKQYLTGKRGLMHI